MPVARAGQFMGPPPDRLVSTQSGFEFASWHLEPMETGHEFTAGPDPATHTVFFGRSHFQAQAFKDGRHVLSETVRRGSCQIMEAGIAPRKVLSGEVSVIKAFIPVKEYRRACAIEGLDPATPLIDPLCAVVPDLARWSDLVSAELGSGTHPPSRLWLDAAGMQLIALLLRHCSPARLAAPPDQRGLPPRLLRLVQQYIDEHIATDISLADLAQLADLSAKHFSRAFRQSTGLPPYRYVVERRVALARRLLRDRTLSLAEIALVCGFADQSHFTATFRRTVGQTPGAYRRSR